MKRAFLIEATVMAQYLRQLLPIGIIVAVAMTIGVGNVSAAASVFVMMACMLSCTAMCAYDDMDNWGAFRLSLPLSRRDVVLGRYAMVIAFALGATFFGIALVVASWTLGQIGVLPESVAAYVALDADGLPSSLFAVLFVLLIGLFDAGVSLPGFFKFGTTKASQYMPYIILVVFVLLAALAGQVLDGGVIMGQISHILAWLENPENLALIAAAVLIACAVILAVSAAVSLRLYEKRDL